MIDLTAKIAQLEALRTALGDAAVDAALAALRTETSSSVVQQRQVAECGTIASSPQSVTQGDMRDNALGSGNVVLHDIAIAEGGILMIGSLPADLPPQPAAVQQALTTYLHTLLERYQFLNLQGLGANNQQARVMLRAVFINVRTNIRSIVDRESLLDAQHLSTDLRQWLDELLSDYQHTALSDATWPQAERLSDTTLTETARANMLDSIEALLATPRTALELIRHHRAFVLLGDPGSGKTTVLRHLALSFAHARLNASNDATATVEPEVAWIGSLPLPILVQVRRFADSLTSAPVDAGPLLNHIEQVFSGDRLDPLARHLLARLEAGSVLLMLDGLDEVANDTRRSWVIQAIAHFHSRFSHSRMVVTSRIYAYRYPFVLPPSFEVATLEPLEADAQDAFIVHWYHAALLQGSELSGVEHAQAAAERTRSLIEVLEQRPRLREIAANPLVLTMIALLHLSGMGLPQQRAELYERCLLLLLEQWEQRRADGDPAGLAVALGVSDQLRASGDRLALIQPIAYQLQLLGREEARNFEVQNWLLERFLDLAGNDVAHARALIARFLIFLEGRGGLLIARDVEDRYGFPHKTFQEYLAARELIYLGFQTMLREIVRQRHTTTWREVILLAVGHLVASGQPEQARMLGRTLLDSDDPGTPAYYRSVALVGNLVEELGSNLGRDGRRLRDETVSELVALVEGSHLTARERVTAALTLGRLGDPRLPMPDKPDYWCDVTAGPFWYSDDMIGPLRQIELPYSFMIARYLVTNAAYARFIENGGYHDQRWWTKQGWTFLQPGGHRFDDQEQRITLPRLWHNSEFNNPSQPIVGISWYEATAYCRWLTTHGHTQGWLLKTAEVRLPTSLEWERSARHTDQRRYPWGTDELTPEHANYQATEIGAPSPVGCFAVGVAVCGAADMVGNVLEWLATPYQMRLQLEVQKDFVLDDRVLLNLSYYGAKEEQICCESQYWFYPDNWSNILGLRVVWSLIANS